jgi:uncharacterized LabA/DUF88 family protein
MQQARRKTTKQVKAPRVVAFIDSQNVNVSIQKLGWKMDWRKLLSYLKKNYGVTRALMFIGYLPEHEGMYEQLHEAGYGIVLKQTQDLTRPLQNEADINSGDEERRPIKGNIDAELVLWAVKEMPNYDKAVIVSGDGDFFCLVEYLESENKLGQIVAPTRHYSSLFNRYDTFVGRLDDKRRQLAYRPTRKTNKDSN